MDLRLAEAEVDDQSHVWPQSALQFKNETYPLAHVVRIPSSSIDAHAMPRQKELFIGFAAYMGEETSKTTCVGSRARGRRSAAHHTDPTP
jgi:hypothetical protein